MEIFDQLAEVKGWLKSKMGGRISGITKYHSFFVFEE